MTLSKYHLGFTSLEQEIPHEQLKIVGSLPSWLNGTLLRVGPAKFEVGNRSYDHWFDGLAMLYRFKFSNNYVTYSNRYLRSNSYKKSIKTGKIAQAEFATSASHSFFKWIKSLFSPDLTDNCNVSINKFADRIVALTDTRLPLQINPETLKTLQIYDYNYIQGFHPPGRVSTAHPHFDSHRNCHYSFTLHYGYKSSYNLFSIDASSGRQKSVAKIPSKHPSFMHSFGMTENYLILTEFPLVVSPLKLMLSGKPFIRNYKWDPERGVQFIIVEKESGNIIKKVQSDAFFAFHHVNAFEENDLIVVDIITYPNANIIDELYLEKLRSSIPIKSTGKLTRYYINLQEGNRVDNKVLSSSHLELPRINYTKYVGHPYRYVFSAGRRENIENSNFLDSLIKVDLELHKSQIWFSEDCFSGEPVFIGAPNAQNEDEGLVLSVVLDVKERRSFLLALDSSSWKELARIELPHHIPFGFHGNYFASFTGPESFRYIHR